MKIKILLSSITVALILSLGVSYSRALFSDTKKNSGNKFSVGTLELSVDQKDGSSDSSTFTIDNLGADSVMSGSKTWVVKNKGTIKAQLYFNVSNIGNFENGCNEPESQVDTTCGNPGKDEGELGKVVKGSVYVNGVKLFTNNFVATDVNAFKNLWNQSAPVILNGGEFTEVKLSWDADANEIGNELQSDSLTFDINFDLVQSIK